jgi:hypothetical protein
VSLYNAALSNTTILLERSLQDDTLLVGSHDIVCPVAYLATHTSWNAPIHRYHHEVILAIILESRTPFEQSPLIGIALEDERVNTSRERTAQIRGPLSELSCTMEEVYAAIIIEEERPVVMVRWP